MILKSLQYNVANLLHSDDAVAICQAEGEKLKDLIFLVHDAGWGFLMIETPSHERFLIFAANRIHEGNLVGAVRGWTRQFDCEFALNFTHWGLATAKTLPAGYVRL